MDDSTYQLLQIVPFLLISIPFAVGNGYLAARIGKNAPLWVILSLIPLVNYVFFIYVAYQVVFFIVDRSAAEHDDAAAVARVNARMALPHGAEGRAPKRRGALVHALWA